MGRCCACSGRAAATVSERRRRALPVSRNPTSGGRRQQGDGRDEQTGGPRERGGHASELGRRILIIHHHYQWFRDVRWVGSRTLARYRATGSYLPRCDHAAHPCCGSARDRRDRRRLVRAPAGARLVDPSAARARDQSRDVVPAQHRIAAQPLEPLTPDADAMRDAMESMAQEVERLAEGQRFLTRVLTEEAGLPPESRPPESGPPESGPEAPRPESRDRRMSTVASIELLRTLAAASAAASSRPHRSARSMRCAPRSLACVPIDVLRAANARFAQQSASELAANQDFWDTACRRAYDLTPIVRAARERLLLTLCARGA
jgi:hypothetical protein